MFERDVLCINGMCDGLTQNKIYVATYIRKESDGEYYGLTNDYGVYNSFKKDRFITITDELIENLEVYLYSKNIVFRKV